MSASIASTLRVWKSVPTSAILRTEFDTVFINEPACNGCRDCIAACPFGVIHMSSVAPRRPEMHALLRPTAKRPAACVFPGVSHAVDSIWQNRRFEAKGEAARAAASRLGRERSPPLWGRRQGPWRPQFVLPFARHARDLRAAIQSQSAKHCRADFVAVEHCDGVLHHAWHLVRIPRPHQEGCAMNPPISSVSFPGSAWERPGRQALPGIGDPQRRGRASQAARSQAEPGNEGGAP